MLNLKFVSFWVVVFGCYGQRVSWLSVYSEKTTPTALFSLTAWQGTFWYIIHNVDCVVAVTWACEGWEISLSIDCPFKLRNHNEGLETLFWDIFPVLVSLHVNNELCLLNIVWQDVRRGSFRRNFVRVTGDDGTTTHSWKTSFVTPDEKTLVRPSNYTTAHF